MRVSRVLISIVFGLLGSSAFAGVDVGSDGSDGALDLTGQSGVVTIDLSLAADLCDCDSNGLIDDACTWGCPSPVAGQGVYDAEQWAVVLKYTSVVIPSGVTVQFARHGKLAPVVWLVEGDINIAGTIDLRGADGYSATQTPIIPLPQPGAFRGGHGGTLTTATAGHGPGGGEIATSFLITVDPAVTLHLEAVQALSKSRNRTAAKRFCH